VPFLVISLVDSYKYFNWESFPFQKNVLALLEPYLDVPSSAVREQSLDSPWELQLHAIQCLEALTLPLKSLSDSSAVETLHACLKIFIAQLEKDRNPKQDEINFCQVIPSYFV